MDKTMVLWTKLWNSTENNGTSIYKGKNMVDYQKQWNYTKIMQVWPQTSELWKNYGTMEKNYGTMDKTQWFYTENNGTSIYEGKKHGRLPKTK